MKTAAVTVAQVLALPVVAAGLPERLTNAPLDTPVRWVHVGDSPAMKDLLTGGELILTTGRSLGEDPAGYVTGLATAGAVGLVVELGELLPAIPPAAVAAARTADMPLIALRRTIRFVDVTEEVHRSIVASQYAEVEFARHAHEVFTSLSMRRARTDDIVTAAADLLGTPVVLEDAARRVLSVAASGRTTADLLRGWERRPAGGVTTLVGVDRQTFAHLVAPLAGPSERVDMVLERAAQALALREMVERDRNALQQQAQSGLIDDLRSGRVPDEPSASARARALGLQTALRYVPLTVATETATALDAVKTQRRQAQAHDAVRHALGGAGLTALTTSAPGRVDMVLACPAGLDDAGVDATGARVATEVRRVHGVKRVVVGAGPAAGRLIDAAGGLDEARHVASIALAMPTDRTVYRAADTRLRGLAALLRDDPRAIAFAESELRPLLNSPKRDELLELLRAFLEAGGQKTALAARLHLSRPTLYARLATLQRVIADLDDPESRTSLHAALLLWDARG